jgi:predicted outer membrane repeat protein
MISLGAVSASEDANSLKDNSDVLSASQDEAIPLSSNDYNKTVYVDSHGDDSGAGTESSPYASLNKAMSDIDASDNAIIYMGAGVYTGEKNTDLNINFAHKNYKGSLTIAGAGAGKTIIDANLESPIFDSISADSIVILKDITFINGKKNLGSAITNNGDLTIDSCVFENNSAGAYATVYQDDPNNLKVVNSVFRNNVAGSANNDIYYYDEDAGYNVTLINSSFYNAASTYNWGDSASVVIQATNVLVQGNNFTNISSSGKSSLQVRSPNGKIINNFFKDCSYTGSSGAILYIAGPGIYLEGNRFENWVSTSNSPIYALMNYNAKLTFNNLTVDGTTFKLTCNLTDDMGNLVTSYYKVNFYFDGKKIGEAQANGGLATLTITKLLGNGNYSLTGDYGNENPMGCDVINATVIVDFNHNPMDVWVSPTGNDTTGNGSEDNPFQTIKTAIDYAIDEDSVEITIHAKEGTYNIQGDYGLSYSDAISLSIVGEKYGKVIIDGNNANGFITSGVYTNVFLQNLTFVNGTGRYSRSFEVRYLTMKDCIVNNSGMLYAQTSPSGIVFDNVIWTNSKNLLMYNGEIYNSHFENITSSGTGNLWLATVNNDDEIIIENSKFINLVTSGSSGAGVAYVQGNFRSINNTYESNKATSNNYGALYVYGNKLVSINDTFINNEASGNYGAAAFFNGRENPSVQIINAKFINNTAGGFGGALGIYGGELINCTFENNTAATLGGAIYMPTHSNTVYLYDLTLDNVIFDGNVAGTNGQDIYIVPATNANNLNSNLNGMTVSMNDLFTTTLQDFVQANVTHSSGAVVGGGAVTFYLSGAYMGVANVVDGVAVLDYLGFKTNGTYVLSGEYNLATADTAYNNATVIVALAPLKDNVTLYVSDSKGDDVNGDGSLDNPYKTIKTALTNGYKQSSVIVVRVLEGNYSGELKNN